VRAGYISICPHTITIQPETHLQRRPTRVSAYSYAMVFCVACLLALLPAESATTNSTAMPEALIGTWRPLTIEVLGPTGPLPDPLFWPCSQGLIMYDRSGWVSVQIYAPNRPPAKGPPKISGAKLSVGDAGLKAAGFDTYACNPATCAMALSLGPFRIYESMRYRSLKKDPTQLDRILPTAAIQRQFEITWPRTPAPAKRRGRSWHSRLQ
jgi:hypothetical protein